MLSVMSNLNFFANKNLKNGVSGLMRVRNERDFIKPCIESCIDALDELVIVYNDCTDGSEEEIEKMRAIYHSKIKVFKYPHRIYGVNLTKEEYEYAKSLPEDSPHLLCSYYNYALSKIEFKYAIKIDADQIYFSKVLTEYCNICRSQKSNTSAFDRFIGRIAQIHLSAYRFLSLKANMVLPIFPSWIVRFYSGFYRSYAIDEFLRGKACLSFSGVNVFHKGNDILVSLGLESEIFNILPPFNGEGDHVLFKVSDDTIYRPFDMSYYNSQRNMAYSLIEVFEHPYRIMPIGFCWFHINADRKEYRDKVAEVENRYPSAFEQVGKLLRMRYSLILKRSSKKMFSIFQRILFGFVFNAYKQDIVSNYDKA